MDKLEIFDLDWKKAGSILLALYGAYLAYSGFSVDSNKKVFWGSVFFFFGLFFFLETFELLNPEIHFFWPVTLIIFGLSFLMLFVNHPSEFALLIPSITLIGFGTLFLMTNLGIVYTFDIWGGMEKFWPVILIALGIYLILKRKPAKS
jgi:hypothetical protein